jgi:hypothetical protein
VVGKPGGTDRDNRRDESSDETRDERSRRKWNEMLQELRVAQTGVQVLTGFLLTLPFSSRFDEIDRTEEVVYLVTVCSSILAAGFLIAPVAFHRVLFGRSEKEWLVEAANRAARVGLGLLAVTMCGVVFLVFSLVVGRVSAYVSSGLTLAVLAVLWVVVPMHAAEDGPVP